MKCETCGKNSSHLKFDEKGRCSCSFCGGFSEAGGVKMDSLITRNRFQVRRDSVMHEGDLIPPHEYDKHERRFKPRKDFLEKYPEQSADTFSREELDSVNYTKLKTKDEKIVHDEPEFEGDENKRMGEVLNG